MSTYFYILCTFEEFYSLQEKYHWEKHGEKSRRSRYRCCRTNITTAKTQMKGTESQNPAGGEEQKWVPRIFLRINVHNQFNRGYDITWSEMHVWSLSLALLQPL